MTPWDQLITGQFIEAIVAGYTNAMGVEIFYSLVAFIAFSLIYFRTKNIGTVAVTGLLVGGSLFVLLPPDVQRIAYFIMAISIAIIIYKLFKS